MIEGQKSLLYLAFIAVLELHSLEIFLSHNLHNGVFELLLEGEVLPAGVELIHEGLAPGEEDRYTSQQTGRLVNRQVH